MKYELAFDPTVVGQFDDCNNCVFSQNIPACCASWAERTVDNKYLCGNGFIWVEEKTNVMA